MSIFAYSFMMNALLAGMIVAIAAPAIGLFLVLRRYALIADTLAHISLAGVALGFLMNVNPLITALVATTGSSLMIERLRSSKRVASEWALALFLAGALAAAIILFSLGHNTASRVTAFLFGNMLTITTGDLMLMAVLGTLVCGTIAYIWRPLITITFDETFARVIGLPVARLNTIVVVLAAVTITLAIPALGVLLISALLTIPVIAALQLRAPMLATLMYAEVISLTSVILGLLIAYTLDLAVGGTIVLVLVAITLLIGILTKRRS